MSEPVFDLVIDCSGGPDVQPQLVELDPADLPPPVRRLIPKSVVQERLNDLGRLADAFAILNADPLNFGRWFAPNHPNVYFDDAGLLTILGPAGLGLTPEQIAAVTA